MKKTACQELFLDFLEFFRKNFIFYAKFLNIMFVSSKFPKQKRKEFNV